jgi:hypothetical protein
VISDEAAVIAARFDGRSRAMDGIHLEGRQESQRGPFLGATVGQLNRFKRMLLARRRTRVLSLCSENKRNRRNRTTRREQAEGKQQAHLRRAASGDCILSAAWRSTRPQADRPIALRPTLTDGLPLSRNSAAPLIGHQERRGRDGSNVGHKPLEEWRSNHDQRVLAFTLHYNHRLSSGIRKGTRFLLRREEKPSGFCRTFRLPKRGAGLSPGRGDSTRFGGLLENRTADCCGRKVPTPGRGRAKRLPRSVLRPGDVTLEDGVVLGSHVSGPVRRRDIGFRSHRCAGSRASMERPRPEDRLEGPEPRDRLTPRLHKPADVKPG